MKNFYKIFFLKTLLSIALTTFVIYLSIDETFWLDFWRSLNIPVTLPPFSDFDALKIFLSYKQDGFDPYIMSPNRHIIHNLYTYPSVWLHIFEFMDLKNEYYFKITCSLILLIYFWILLDLFFKYKETKFIYILIIFFFSTTNFLLIERLNIEIIIFILIYFLIFSKKIVAKIIFFILPLILKIFPIFSIFIFIDRRKIFYCLFLLSTFYLILFKNEIYMISKNTIEYALMFSYGVPSISKAIYYYSIKLNYFINDENYNFFKFILIIFFSIYGAAIFIITLINNKNKKLDKKITIEEQMFLVGGGIYIGTFLTAANIDYRLVFLILTLPYLIYTLKSNLIYIYLVIISVCFNSILLQTDNHYGYIFAISGFLIYFFKILIFTVNCYYFGYILSKFINSDLINFKKI